MGGLGTQLLDRLHMDWKTNKVIGKEPMLLEPEPVNFKGVGPGGAECRIGLGRDGKTENAGVRPSE